MEVFIHTNIKSRKGFWPWPYKHKKLYMFAILNAFRPYAALHSYMNEHLPNQSHHIKQKKQSLFMVTYQFQLINPNNGISDVLKQLESNRSSPGQSCCVFVSSDLDKASRNP